MWNKKKILVGDIQKAWKDKKLIVKKIKLEIASDSDSLQYGKNEKKLKKLQQKSSRNSMILGSNANVFAKVDKERREQMSKDIGDYFELVECQDVQIKLPNGQS